MEKKKRSGCRNIKKNNTLKKNKIYRRIKENRKKLPIEAEKRKNIILW